MIPSPQFSAKILLFGEYSILKGSGALATPLKTKTGWLRFACVAGQRSPEAQNSQKSLIRLFAYLEAHQNQFKPDDSPDLAAFRNDLISGLFFDSNIPKGYGIGSSAALSAAVYDTYFAKPKSGQLSDTIRALSLIESCFHQKSSGIDPLVSYLSKTILVENGLPQTVDFSLDWLKKQCSIALLDSGKSGITRTSQQQHILDHLNQDYLNLNNLIIQKLVSQNPDGLCDAIQGLSKYQLTLFDELFPDKIKKLSIQGQKTGEFAIKLCGSGGGGYYLVFWNNQTTLPPLLAESGLELCLL